MCARGSIKGVSMKKTIVATLLIIVILAASLTGCTFIRANEQRQLEQTLIVVEKDGLKLSVTQMELIDNINSSVYNYVQYGMTVEQAINYVIEGRVQSKILVIEAMQYLPTVERRRAVQRNATVTKPEDVLTYAEYCEAIIAVNNQIQDSIDNYVKEYEDNLKKTEVTNASKNNVEKIEIESGLNEEYIVGESLALDDLKLRIVYKDGTEAVIPVISSMVDTEFSSQSAGDFELILALDVNVEKDGVVETEKIKTENGKYTVKAAPTVKTTTLDDENYNPHSHSNAYIDSIRYMTEAELRTWVTGNEAKKYDYNNGKGVVPTPIDLEAMPTADMSAAEKDAWRRLKTNLTTNYRSPEYYYRSNFESQVLSALQHELYQNVDEEIASDGDFNASVLEQFSALSAQDSVKYERMTVKDRKSAFISAISSSLESLYFCPSVENLNEYYYVQHVLFKFDDETFNFIKANNLDPIKDKKEFEKLVSRQKVREANPLYDASYECGAEHFDEDGNYIANPEGCKFNVSEYLNLGKSNYQYMIDHPDGQYYCPSVAYLRNETPVTDVLAEFADALATAKSLNDTQKLKETFEWFIYRFSDVNSGSFNNDLGYLITPDKSDSSLVDGFYAFGKLLGAQAEYKAENEGIYTVSDEVINGNGQYGAYVMKYQSKGGNALQYVVGTDNSSYAGIHVLMLQKVPFTTSADWNYESFVNSANDKTISKALADGIISTRRSTAYSNFTSEKLKDYDEREDVTVTKEEKKIKSLISQYTGS